MKYLIYTKILFGVSILFFSCNSQKRIAGNYSYKTECLGLEMDGSQTVKAWGPGKNRMDEIEHAKKIAVKDVLFNGIYEGKQDCEKRPVIVEVNARQKYETYFNEFFSDKGEYKKFVSLNDGYFSQKVSGANKNVRYGFTQGVVLRVLRAELKQKMIEDGILKN